MSSSGLPRISNRTNGDQRARRSNNDNHNGDNFSTHRRRHQSAPPTSRFNCFREPSNRSSPTTSVQQGSTTTLVPARPSSVRGPLPPRPQLENLQYVEHHSWERRGATSGNGFYAARGFSANRGQLVYFNCLTTTPLNVSINQGQINMDVPNGFGGNYAGHANGQPAQHQMRHHHQANGHSGGRSAQTVNHGSSIYNFYFVNSGQYDLNFTSNGLPGVGHPTAPSYQPQQPQSFNSCNATYGSSNNSALFSAGNPFPNANMAMYPHQNLQPGMYGQPHFPAPGSSAMFGSNMSTASNNYPRTRVPGGAFQAFVNGNAWPPAQNGPTPLGIPNTHAYRQRDQSFHSLSQGSLDNFEDMYQDPEDQDVTCLSQCSMKSGPSAFYGPQPPPMM